MTKLNQTVEMMLERGSKKYYDGDFKEFLRRSYFIFVNMQKPFFIYYNIVFFFRQTIISHEKNLSFVQLIRRVNYIFKVIITGRGNFGRVN